MRTQHTDTQHKNHRDSSDRNNLAFPQDYAPSIVASCKVLALVVECTWRNDVSWVHRQSTKKSNGKQQKKRGLWNTHTEKKNVVFAHYPFVWSRRMRGLNTKEPTNLVPLQHLDLGCLQSTARVATWTAKPFLRAVRAWWYSSCPPTNLRISKNRNRRPTQTRRHTQSQTPDKLLCGAL